MQGFQANFLNLTAFIFGLEAISGDAQGITPGA